MASTSTSTSRGLLEPINIPNAVRRTCCIYILYATQTGNSRLLAARLKSHLIRNRFNVKSRSLNGYTGQQLSFQADDYDFQDQQDQDGNQSSCPLPPVFIFLISTTGVGDFPSPSIPFWNSLLRSDLPNDTFDHLQFLTFALGDSSYERFCWPARKLNRRFKALGAVQFAGIEEVEADERHYLGIDGTYLPWLSDLTEKLNALDPLPSKESLIPEDALLPPQVDIDFVPLTDSKLISNGNGLKESSTSSSSDTDPLQSQVGGPGKSKSPIPKVGGWKEAKLTRNDRMTSEDHYQDVRLIDMERNDGEKTEHRPGDIAVLLPSNSKEHIDRLIKALGWEEEAERLIVVRKKRRKDHQDEDEDDDDDDEIDPDSIPSHSPTSPLTLRSFLTHHLSPLSIPDLSFFHTLFTFSPPHLFNQLDQLPENPSGKGYDVNDGESLERSKLKEFITPGEGQDECFEYSGRVRRTKLEVLEEFGNTSKRIPVRFCVELLGWMNEREFSIASGAKIYPNKIQLSIALVKYKTRLKEPRKGICSRWLEDLQVGSTFPFRITSGTLSSQSPPSSNLPLVLVGPGTGVAPMRAFIHDRLVEARNKKTERVSYDIQDIPNTLLFCGCRFRRKDFLFGKEWEQLSSSDSKTSQPPSDDELLKTDSNISSPYDAFFSYQLAASRDSEEKVYVQDLMKQDSQSRLLWQTVGRLGGSVFVSGSSGPMPKAVRKALELACINHGEMDQDQAQRFLLKLEKEGRWREECWT